MNSFFALSRTQHGIIDLATPAFIALIWLGHFPSLGFTVLALTTGFAGYTAIYALNDLLGYKADKEKHDGGLVQSGYSVEASPDHHPLVQGLLSKKAAMTWIVFWLSIAFIGAYLLNPIIVLILLVGGVFEAIYCKLLKVTHLRILLSGVVKACGPIAAIYAVDATPRIDYLLLVFTWVFLWEVGGQNIPADWNDVDEDKRIGAKTIPARFGSKISATVILLSIIATLLVSASLSIISPAMPSIPWAIASFIIGYFLLLRPALYLWRTNNGAAAARLFDRASYYPLALFILTSVWMFIAI